MMVDADLAGPRAPSTAPGDHRPRRRRRRRPAAARAPPGRRPGRDVTAIVNVGDDLVLHGLHDQPRPRHRHLHAGRRHQPRDGLGPGRRDVAGHGHASAATAASTWFNLGDRDLGTHLYRTAAAVARARRSPRSPPRSPRAGTSACALLPVTDDPLRTMVTVVDRRAPTAEVGFQEYFVQRHHAVPVAGVRFAGADGRHARHPACSSAIVDADVVVIAPSNPIVSIGPVLRRARRPRRGDGPARRTSSPSRRSSPAPRSKGPADRMLTELGHEASVVGVARLYADGRRRRSSSTRPTPTSRRPSRPRACAASSPPRSCPDPAESAAWPGRLGAAVDARRAAVTARRDR